MLVNTKTKKNRLKMYKKYWILYVFLILPISWMVVFDFFPMYGYIIAFKDYRAKLGFWDSEWVGLEHFIRFVTYPEFWKLIKNTVMISLYGLALFPINIIIALLFNEIQNAKFKKTVQMITYAPHFLSTVVMCGMITLFFGRDGFIGEIYTFFTGKENNLLAVPEFFRHIYIWTGKWQGFGWGTILYLSALSSVSPELVDAAKIDGATRTQVIRHVNIPAIIPTIVISFIMSTGSILSVGFEKIFLLQNDLNMETSRVINTYTYEIGIIGGQFSYSTAIGMFNTVINLLMLLLANRIVKAISGTGIW